MDKSNKEITNIETSKQVNKYYESLMNVFNPLCQDLTSQVDLVLYINTFL